MVCFGERSTASKGLSGSSFVKSAVKGQLLFVQAVLSQTPFCLQILLIYHQWEITLWFLINSGFWSKGSGVAGLLSFITTVHPKWQPLSWLEPSLVFFQEFRGWLCWTLCVVHSVRQACTFTLVLLSDFHGMTRGWKICFKMYPKIHFQGESNPASSQLSNDCRKLTLWSMIKTLYIFTFLMVVCCSFVFFPSVCPSEPLYRVFTAVKSSISSWKASVSHALSCDCSVYHFHAEVMLCCINTEQRLKLDSFTGTISTTSKHLQIDYFWSTKAEKYRNPTDRKIEAVTLLIHKEMYALCVWIYVPVENQISFVTIEFSQNRLVCQAECGIHLCWFHMIFILKLWRHNKYIKIIVIQFQLKMAPQHNLLLFSCCNLGVWDKGERASSLVLCTSLDLLQQLLVLKQITHFSP